MKVASEKEKGQTTELSTEKCSKSSFPFACFLNF
jgi:hypothetical protein